MIMTVNMTKYSELYFVLQCCFLENHVFMSPVMPDMINKILVHFHLQFFFN